jgi:hypothetical protein
MNYRWFLFGFLVLSLLALDGSAQSLIKSDGKLLIELGWDAPTPDVLRANIKAVQQSPFAGLTLQLNAGRTIFNKVAYPEGTFVKDQRDLAATQFGQLKHNFISIWSARENGWDWFNDHDWAATETNAQNFAKTAKAGHLEGFFFDPEPYGTNPWSYNSQLYPTQNFASVQAKVRQRGAGFLNAVQSQMPKVKILMLFGASVVKAQAEDAGRLEKADWVLLASFIDGMLDVINKEAELIDGNEGSYYYTLASGFSDFRAYQQAARAYVSPENRVKYDRQVKIAHAVFVDGLLNLLKSPRFFGYYLQNDLERQQFLEYSTFHALQNSDRYVWVYNEDMDWWNTRGKGIQLPVGLSKTLKRSVLKVNQKRNLGFNTDFANQARQRHNTKVQVFGRIATKAGQGVGGVLINAGFLLNGQDTACQYSNPDGYFSCTVPPNWNGTITPVLQDYGFSPAKLEFKNLTQETYDQNFEAIKK